MATPLLSSSEANTLGETAALEEIAMRKLTLWVIVFAALPAGALLAQDLTGSWQGTLSPAPGRDLRTVFKISKGDNGALKATLYSIDQGAQGFGSSSVTLQGSTVKIAIAGLGGSYEGKLSGDGDSIAGSWTQGPRATPLNLVRATPATAWAIPEPAPTKPMNSEDPSFEVATIKPGKPGTPGKLFSMRGREFTTVNTTVGDILSMAYDIHARQIIGAPAWLESDKFDILAKPDAEGIPNRKQIDIMMQKLLADRFKLKFHHEQKELPVYAIVIGKNGPKLTKSEADPNGLPRLLFQGFGVLPVHNASLSDFAMVMQAAVLDRPVVDHTGLTGKWDFTLKWTPDETQFATFGVRIPPPADNASAPPDLFTAMQEQLGLKLEPTKAPVDVLVIDQIEKPSEN
jgi:uncharacterized protein (TIGR03435 family)